MAIKTVFVVGAGASKEVGLPLGSELKEIISSKLASSDGSTVADKDIDRAFKLAGRSNLAPVASSISDSLVLFHSIDSYIHAHRGNGDAELCAKVAIAKSILESEESSDLLIESGRSSSGEMDFNKLKETWFVNFFKIITTGCSLSDLSGRFSEVALVIFNYDRCVEYFLAHAIAKAYLISESDAFDLVAKLKIVHAYGSLGQIFPSCDSQSSSYGMRVSAESLLSIAAELRTFTEGLAGADDRVSEIRSVVAQCENLVFLGFAFNKLNMDLITPPDDLLSAVNIRRVFATIYGIDVNEKTEVVERVKGVFSGANSAVTPSFVLAPLECWQFLENYHLGLENLIDYKQ